MDQNLGKLRILQHFSTQLGQNFIYAQIWYNPTGSALEGRVWKIVTYWSCVLSTMTLKTWLNFFTIKHWSHPLVHWCDSKAFRTWHYSLSLLYCLSWFIEMPLGYKPPTSIFLPRWGVQLQCPLLLPVLMSTVGTTAATATALLLSSHSLDLSKIKSLAGQFKSRN